MARAEIRPLPATRARVLRLLNEPDTAAREVASVVETDPSLTAIVLRAANAAYSAPQGRITAARDAVVRIGLEETRRLVASSVLGDSFDGVAYAGVDTDELWRHLLSVALLTDACTTQIEDRKEAFTAGLLHDIGRLAMAAYDPDRYGRVVEVARHGIDPRRSEFLLFGSDHADWGVRVGWEWGLPATLVGAIAEHHESATTSTLARAVGVARRISRQLGIGDGLQSPTEAERATTPEPRDAHALRSLGGAEGLFARIESFRETLAA